MYSLTLRQWLSNLWENLFPLIVLNVLATLAFSAIFVVPSLVWGVSPLVYALSLLGAVLAVAWIAAGISQGTYEMSEARPFRFKSLPSSMKTGFAFFFALGLVFYVAILVFTQMFPFYASVGETWSFAALVVLALGLAIGALTFGYWGPMKARDEGSFGRIVSQSLAAASQYPLWTLFVFFGHLVIVTVSTFTVSLFPGIGGLFLWQHVAYRILRKKIETDSGKGDWPEFLKQERELLRDRFRKKK